MKTPTKYLYIGIAVFFCIFPAQGYPNVEELRVSDIPVAGEIQQQASSAVKSGSGQFDPLKYKLGPDDVVEIAVMRHPEFSGTYPIDREGKIQYKFVGDLDVNGLTKQEVEDKVRNVISNYVIAPEVNVTITEYKSKVIYIIGEVTTPGKYYMRSESINVRDAVFQAGLPTVSAAMRKCQLITPSDKGNPRIKNVNLYSVIYRGNLKRNIDMHPGDILYVPSTVMAKVIRIINPVASTVGVASAGPSNASSGKTAVETLAK